MMSLSLMVGIQGNWSVINAELLPRRPSTISIRSRRAVVGGPVEVPVIEISGNDLIRMRKLAKRPSPWDMLQIGEKAREARHAGAACKGILSRAGCSTLVVTV